MWHKMLPPKMSSWIADLPHNLFGVFRYGLGVLERFMDIIRIIYTIVRILICEHEIPCSSDWIEELLAMDLL